MELPLFILSIFIKKNRSTKSKRTVLQKAKEPFYKRQKNRSTKSKRTVLQKAKELFYKRKKSRSTKGKRFVLQKLKKKLLKRSRYTEINCRNMKENIK